MKKLSCLEIVLTLLLSLSSASFKGNLHAVCDPCPQQSISGEIVNNSDMEFDWAEGQPPSEFDSDGQAFLEVIGGTGEYVWEVGKDDDAEFMNGLIIDSTISPDRTNRVILGAAADCSITVTVTNKGKTLPPAQILQNPDSLSFDYDRTGLLTVARNSSKAIHVNGGIPPFNWTVSTPGFYFDSYRTLTQITTETNSHTIYTDNTECGTADISVSDDCGQYTEGIVRRSVGKWGSYVEVAQILGSETGCKGCDKCWMYTGNQYYFCPDEAPIKYKVRPKEIHVCEFAISFGPGATL